MRRTLGCDAAPHGGAGLLARSALSAHVAKGMHESKIILDSHGRGLNHCLHPFQHIVLRRYPLVTGCIRLVDTQLE